MLRLLPLFALFLPLSAYAGGVLPLSDGGPAAYRLPVRWSEAVPRLAYTAPAYAVFHAPTRPQALSAPDLGDDMGTSASEPSTFFDPAQLMPELDLWLTLDAPGIPLP